VEPSLRHLRSPLAAALVALVVALGVGAPAFRVVTPVRAAATTGPKVVIVVGATHGVTSTYRSYANAAYAEAIKYTPNVVKVYSPNATWAAVKAAAKGASILIYFGHGNGWPSPYTYDSKYTTKDGFGLNATAGDGDYNNKYYGEPYVSTLELADNAIVMLHHLCYASGNSEPGGAAPSVSTAKQRIDNYGAGFLRGGKARAVLADGHHGPADYLKAIFTTNQTIEALWRNAPDANGHVSSFAGTRSAGKTAFMDPDNATSGFYRSLVGDRDLTTKQITGGFAVPGHAAPKADGAPIYDEIPTLTDTTAPVEPAAVLPPDTRLTLLEKVAGSGDTAVYKTVGLDDPAITGFVVARDIEPRDSIAPYLAKFSGGSGLAYATGATDGVHTLAGTFNEAAAWTVTVKRGEATVGTKSGSGTSFSLGIDAAAFGDGGYSYRITRKDDWANAATTSGTFSIDNVAPALTSVSPGKDTVRWVSPNGDLAKESVDWGATISEAGSIGLKVVDGEGATVRSIRVTTGKGTVTVAWDGRTSTGKPVADGEYEVRLTPRDGAGNDGKTVVRHVLVDTTLGDVDASRVLFYPQDGDRLSRTTTLRFALTRPATVTWTLVDQHGATAMTLLDAVALPAGPVTRVFDGKRADGTYLPRGDYRSLVSVAGDGPVPISQYRTVKMRAFDPRSSDATPRRGQRITIYATSAETLSTSPRVYVYQPGKATWSVAMSKVSTGKYKATLTVKTGGGSGEIRFRVNARDVDGRSQSSNLYLPLH
jgi:flagellar hook assembly protein FlgD